MQMDYDQFVAYMKSWEGEDQMYGGNMMGVADVWVSDILAEDKPNGMKIQIVMGAKQLLASAASLATAAFFAL